jgi:predicted nucleic acid-binding protein
MKIVSNTSPLINLAMIGELELIQKLYNTIYIPQAVFDEIVIQGKGQAGAKQIKNSSWIIDHPIDNTLLTKSLSLQLDKGEAEAIALSIELFANLILLDEKRGRAIATQFNLRPLGILGILIHAKKMGLIPLIKPLIDRLRNHAGFWIDNQLYQYVLTSADE